MTPDFACFRTGVKRGEIIGKERKKKYYHQASVYKYMSLLPPYTMSGSSVDRVNSSGLDPGRLCLAIKEAIFHFDFEYYFPCFLHPHKLVRIYCFGNCGKKCY
ncbi:hypothetical protein ACP275_10G017400 [Erythranthe tilingii]